MIITKATPFTKTDVQKIEEQFGSYIKTVIDIEKKICSAGASLHFESEKILLEQRSAQSNIWGGGIDIDTKEIDFNSFINIRSSNNNPSNEILDPEIRKKYHELTLYFFKNVL